jgi:exodeoxyribonuclease VII large subunit
VAQDIARRREKLAQTAARLQPAMQRNLVTHRKHLDGAARMLESLSHKSVLARGFVMVHREDGSLVRAARDLSPGDAVELTFADEKQRAVIDPTHAAPDRDAEPPKPRAKPKPGGDQGSLF